MISYSWVWNLCIFTIYSVITRSLGECRLPVKTLQLEQMAVMGQAEEPSVVASRMRLVFSTLEVSFLVCVLRNRLLSYLYFVNLNQERIWHKGHFQETKKEKVWSGGRAARERPCCRRIPLFFSPRCVYSGCMFKLMVLGDGGYPSFVVAGFLPGGRGFLRSVDAGSSSREAEARLAPSSSASVSEG